MKPFSYVRDEHLPVELLVFEVAPDDLDDFLRIEYEIWTLQEADVEGIEFIPFLSKEIWLNDNRPGEVTVVIVWESLDLWLQVGEDALQQRLTAAFDERFGRPYRLTRALHDEENFGVHRFSRFERR